ncbi:MAG: hypothetical protein EU542_02600 [Promethearchaeota archaeon]|nr:MAG: hypothetical protein EU542_02600 [Candidatus Lokiarchaeota archaeon]
MDYALMFDVLEGGVSQPIKWDKNSLTNDRNIIILDEGSSSLYLWHGSAQGLVARRTALRQAESLKGHGFTVGKSIVGRDIKMLKEIDQRKIGRDPETDRYNEELEEVLNREYKELDNFIISYASKDLEMTPVKTVPKPEQKTEPRAEVKPETKPLVEKIEKPTPITPPEPSQASKSDIPVATEYSIPSKKIEVEKPRVVVKPESKTEAKPVSVPKSSEPMVKPLDLSIQAKIGFVIMGILDHYDDIWISKKEDGAYAVEHMDGRVCEFTISEGKIKFTANSFAGIATNVKTEIQKKFVELSKLI